MNNRPVASLSPTLLARKGAARPAMRPQLQPLRAFQDNTARQLDDLGWNDMGHEAETPDESPLAQLPIAPQQADEPQTAEPQTAEPQTAEPQTAEIVALNPGGEHMVANISPICTPEVVQQQDQIAERLAQPRRSALSDGRRAAFTLRIDSERHLKLRLASLTSNRSAQQLVTEALDRLIADLPQLGDLAAKVRKGR